MMLREFHFLPPVFLLLAALGGSAYADPITTLRFTSGVVVHNGHNEEVFWEASGRSIFFFMDGGIELPLAAPFRAPYDVSHNVRAAGDLGGGAFLRIGSQQVSLTDPVIDAVFSSPPQPLEEVEHVPPSAGGPAVQAFFTRFPFQMVGTLTGRDFTTHEQLRFALEGQGHGHLAGRVSDAGIFNPFAASWGFEPSAPIPEPGTLLLLSAAGLAALRQRQRLRK